MKNDRGFSLIEMVVIVAVIGIVAAMATPVITDVVESMRLGASARELERELQTARLKSVQTNRRLQVRTNCPVQGQYRIIEALGTATDTAGDRCSATAYPYPSTDTNPALRTLPHFDGPVRRVYADVTIPTSILEFRPDGTAYQVTSGVASPIIGTGVVLTVTRKSRTRSVTINGLGKIQLQ